jgi:dye decolorizing peroxidase
MTESTPVDGKSVLSRRTALIAGGGVVLGAAAIATAVGVATRTPGDHESAVSAPFGTSQAGIARPSTPQKHGVISIFDFTDRDSADFIGTLQQRLRDISREIPLSIAVDQATRDGDVTVTIGLGPRVVAAIDPTLPGSTDLPLFADDEIITDNERGGDLLVAVYANDPEVVRSVAQRVVRDIPALQPRWHQEAQRGAGEGSVVRNPLGFKDGIIVPHGPTALDDNVWLREGPLAGGTICVIRRLRLKGDEFRSESLARQEQIIGRHKVDGSPLSGGAPDAAIDVESKTAEGEFLTPPRSHARAAHPAFTGSALMLRRGYAFDNGTATLDDGTTVDDSGLLFICFQHDLDTFVKSQHRIDELDDLRQYTTTTASATFLMLPGFTEAQPLGASLFAK